MPASSPLPLVRSMVARPAPAAAAEEAQGPRQAESVGLVAMAVWKTEKETCPRRKGRVVCAQRAG